MINRSFTFPLFPVATFVALAFLARSSFADLPPAEEEDTPGLERLHTGVGETVREIADRLDRFFGDQRIDEEEQDSRLRVEPILRWQKGDAPDLSLRLRLNLTLPRLENKWHVLLRSVSEDEDLEDADGAGMAAQTSSEDTKTQTLLGIRFAPIAKQAAHLSFSGGAKLRGGGVHPFLRARYRRTRTFTKWSAELTQSGFWFSDDGFGERTRVAFERRVGESAAFRATTRTTWSETSKGVDFEQILTIRRFFDVHKAAEFSLRAEGHTRPSTIIDTYMAQVAYRQVLYSDWVFSEVGVQARFPREQGYDLSPGLYTSLAIVF